LKIDNAVLDQLKRFGMIIMFTNENKIRVGEFISYREAEEALKKLIEETQLQNGVIVKDKI
jgi:hypothetical protein